MWTGGRILDGMGWWRGRYKKIKRGEREKTGLPKK